METIKRAYFHIDNGGINVGVKYDENTETAFLEVYATHFDCQTNHILMPISREGMKSLSSMFSEVAEMNLLKIKKPVIVNDPEIS